MRPRNKPTMGQNHELGSERVSKWLNVWAQRSARGKWAVRSKQMRERFERTSERTREWPSTYVSFLCCSEPQWNPFHSKAQTFSDKKSGEEKDWKIWGKIYEFNSSTQNSTHEGKTEKKESKKEKPEKRRNNEKKEIQSMACQSSLHFSRSRNTF